MNRKYLIHALAILFFSGFQFASAEQYYAYEGVEDSEGVIAPWNTGQGGQCDFRVRVAAETIKRFPWVGTDLAVTPAPHYLYKGSWSINSAGTISINTSTSGGDGDLMQRAAIMINTLIDYYRYTGDAEVIGLIHIIADYIVNYGQTPSDHPWPEFLISVPRAGQLYGVCDPNGYMQLDIAAETGIALIRAYKMLGKPEWLDAAVRWADLFAERRNTDPAERPWPRYANPEVVPWGGNTNGNIMTGGIAFVNTLFDELIALGFTGDSDSYIDALDAGREYLRDTLLPAWYENVTWGYNYWDTVGPFSNNNVLYWNTKYLMHHPDYFPNWQSDVPNILTIHINRTSANPDRKVGVYSGAWAYSESPSCCGDSDSYGPQRLAACYLIYAALTGDEWAREMGRRQIILNTYDGKATGQVIDGILSNVPVVAGSWFKIATPMALRYTLECMSWLPEVLAPNRENHLLRAGSIVQTIQYQDGLIEYTSYDAPVNCVDVLRLSFVPTQITGDGQLLSQRSDLDDNGYTVTNLASGDCIVKIRRDGLTTVSIAGDDPQQVADDGSLSYQGTWTVDSNANDTGGQIRKTVEQNAEAAFTFTGNQVRVIGRVAPAGGKADVYIDDVKQLVSIDFWSPDTRHKQVVYYLNSLSNTSHTLRIVAQGNKNLVSQGNEIYIDAVQYSAQQGDEGFGSGGGPQYVQRAVLGYPQRHYIDSNNRKWRPFSEVLTPVGGSNPPGTAWWTLPQAATILNTADPDLYKHGIHAADFTANFTVGPGVYQVLIKLAETRDSLPSSSRVMDIEINGKREIANLDIAEMAGGFDTALDLTFNSIYPKNGIISIRFKGTNGNEAIAQAIQICPLSGDLTGDCSVDFNDILMFISQWLATSIP